MEKKCSARIAKLSKIFLPLLFVLYFHQSKAQTYLDIHIDQPDVMDIMDASITDATCPGVNDGSVSLTLTGGTSPYIYQWENGMTGSGIEDLSPGYYFVSISDFHNCSLKDTFQVEMKRTTCLKDITAFTPNGDGKNDVWNIPGLKKSYPESEIYIYNRRGDLLHKAKAIDSGSDKGLWNGRYNDKLLPTDTYHFIIISDNKVIKEGNVTLLR